jgi:hypothetical protein
MIKVRYNVLITFGENKRARKENTKRQFWYDLAIDHTILSPDPTKV